MGGSQRELILRQKIEIKILFSLLAFGERNLVNYFCLRQKKRNKNLYQ